MSNTAPTVNIEQRIEQYVALRDLIKQKDDAHKEAMKPYRDTLEKLNAVLLNHLNQVGVDSAATGAGTVYRTQKKSASIADGDAFFRHVIGSEAWHLLDKKANATAVEDFIKENGSPPPGVNYSTTHVVGVRRK